MLSLKRDFLAASFLRWPGVTMRCHTGSTATQKSKFFQSRVQTCSLCISSPEWGVSWTRARGSSTYRDLSLIPAFPRGSAFLHGLHIWDRGYFGKCCSTTGFLGEWGADLFFKHICWAGCFPLSSVNLISVEKETNLHFLFIHSNFNSTSFSGGSKSQGCTSLPSNQALSSEPSKERNHQQ